ncbi:MAG: response regulator [Planctomycetes bacterium]|nr:response regulator [Planctomycetota bacterium]
MTQTTSNSLTLPSLRSQGADSARLGGASVLVIEDDLDARCGLQILLRANGLDVVSHGDGQNAIAMIQKVKPDVIILDLGLPGLDGFEVLERLESLRPQLKAKVIVLSAWDVVQNKQRALNSGARFFFQKPTSEVDLMLAIRTIVEELH